MRIVRDFPHAIREHRTVWIPMPDGIRLAARIWMPEDATENPVPAILEYIPYRRNDLTAVRDAVIHPYFAGHGYAAVRVDLRGSGDSEGVLKDEYLEQELDDGERILEWLAEQPWCDGNVGMIGISWGGFNGLQIAARQPPRLKAVVTLCSTDDRYADDVHYMGGCLLGDNLSWASVMFSYNACPPDPENVGERWRDMWMERLESSGLWLETWLEHQHRDAYWKHGSVCEEWDAVRCPVLAASGWADGYTNSVFRLMERLPGPRLGLVGPWSHKFPHMGVPGPAIGFLQECLRWWDHWLKGRATGIMEEPRLRVWLQDAASPKTAYEERPGRWVCEDAWPSPNTRERRYALAHESRLVPLAEGQVPEDVGGAQALEEISPLSVGLYAGKWCAYTEAPDLPGDQREDDGGSLVFQTEPLENPLDLLGAPVVEMEVEADQPVAMVCVRLSDMGPDRKATRLTYGLLNLTHRDSHEHPSPLEPGRKYPVRVQLNDVGHRFPAGHRVRISISTSYWPLAWAPPRKARVTLHTERCVVRLPERPGEVPDGAVAFGPPEGAPPSPLTVVAAPVSSWQIRRDLTDERSTLEVVKDAGTIHLPDIDLTIARDSREWYTFRGDDFESVRGETYAAREFTRGDWSVRCITRTVLTSTPEHFHVRAELDAYEGDERVFSRNWGRRIPRVLV